MSRRFTPKAVTANHLLEGDAVWLTADNAWTRTMSEAQFLDDEDLANERLAYALTQEADIVGPYLADAQLGENGPEPTHFRETFRTRGPSNYAHGKQVEVA